ncbi:hypothetical protein ACNH6C_04725 [Bdellovibrio bacteriovorus]|uniref:hypothetical protein n=1 Tax=Bdellovibrio bacteriovorus TaxID=959 RepID=UPI003A80FA99
MTVTIKTICWVLLFATCTSFADDKPAPKKSEPIAEKKKTDLKERELDDKIKHRAEQAAAAKADKEAQACQKAVEKIDESNRKIAEACRKGGLSGSSDCVTKAKQCAEQSGTSSYDALSSFAVMMGVPATALAGKEGPCPQMNGRDYFSEKDKITEEIKDLQEELNELNKERIADQDEFSQMMTDTEKELSEARETLNENKLQLERDSREQLVSFQNEQNQVKEIIRRKGDEVLELQGQLTQSHRDRARTLIMLSESAAKRKCVAELAKLQQEFVQLYPGANTTPATYIGKAKEKRQQLVAFYHSCMSDFDQQRIAVNEAARQRQDVLEKKIQNLRVVIDEAENTLNLSGTHMQEIEKASSERKSNAQQKVVDQTTQAQKKLQLAYSKLQETLKGHATKAASLNASLNRANQALLSLGPAPKSKSSEYTPSEAAGDIEAELNSIYRIKRSVVGSCAKQVRLIADEALESLEGSQ